MKVIAASRQMATIFPEMFARSLQTMKLTPDIVKSLERLASIFDSARELFAKIGVQVSSLTEPLRKAIAKYSKPEEAARDVV
jgi:hypothetical protein